MKMIKGIPALPVQNISTATEFYKTSMGFTVAYYDAGFAKPIRDEVELHLWGANDESWKSKGAALSSLPVCSGAETFLAGTGSCRIEVQDINDLFEYFKKQGIYL